MFSRRSRVEPLLSHTHTFSRTLTRTTRHDDEVFASAGARALGALFIVVTQY